MPRNNQSSFRFWGHRALVMASTLSGMRCGPCASTMYPRYSTEGCINWHFISSTAGCVPRDIIKILKTFLIRLACYQNFVNHPAVPSPLSVGRGTKWETCIAIEFVVVWLSSQLVIQALVDRYVTGLTSKIFTHPQMWQTGHQVEELIDL